MKDENTPHHMHLVLHPDEYEKLCVNARKSGLTRTAYLRRLIMDIPIKENQPQEIRDLYFEINRIGNNINQIARSVNAGIATPETAQQALFLLKKVYEVMSKIAWT